MVTAMSHMSHQLVGRYALGVVAVVLLIGPARAEEGIVFNRDIRPILSENCFRCHGPDSASRKADLRLDKREQAVEQGVIVPGDADNSEIISRIFSTDPKEMMPPPTTHKTLTQHQKELLKKWVAGGAEFQPYWVFLAPKRGELPAVKNEGWAKTPIDRFILARLEAEGLSPAPEADRRTLARRVAIDTTGLLPTFEAVETFVNDTAPNAYEKFIDRLMATPQWGEHRARYWLDYARYADTHGIHFDNYREIWAYRDWVIGAFNQNMPFDQFTIEQLAGDLLPNATLDQQVASGFNRCNITTSEGGTIPEEYLVLYARDRTEATSSVWLGLTTGCAVCHDHKFDPLSQREFYSLSAFFNNTTQEAMDGNRKDTQPTIPVPAVEDKSRWLELTSQLGGAKKTLEQRRETARAEFDKWLAHTPLDTIAKQMPLDTPQLQLALNEGTGTNLSYAIDGAAKSAEVKSGLGWEAGHVAAQAGKIQPGDSIEIAEAGDFGNHQAFAVSAWIRLSKDVPYGAVLARMDEKDAYRGWDFWLDGNRPGCHLIHHWEDDAIKVVSNNPLKPGQWNYVTLTYDGSGKAAGVRIYVNGAQQPVRVDRDQLTETIRTKVPLKIGQRNNSSRADGVVLNDVRIYGRALEGVEIERLSRTTRVMWLASKSADQRSPQEKDELFGWWLPTTDVGYRDAINRIARLEKEMQELRARGTQAYVMNDKKEPAKAYVLNRGQYDLRGDEVKPGTPAVLPPFPADSPRNRLGLARWLLLPEHPLTARVTVNRCWQEIFGTGIVRTAADLGSAGELPSHQDLLDWLAVELRESGWNLKHIYKLILMSAAYRQSAVATPGKLEKDPQNRLLAQGPRFRMDAEMIRDCALEASGLLVPKIGGPSVKPYQPPGVWEAVAMKESNTRAYQQDRGDKLYRRSMYTFWKRAAPPAAMEVLNAPAREFCTIRRERTNTPLQALVTLNDPQLIEAARALAQRAILGATDGAQSRVDFMAQRLLARPLRSEEGQVMRASAADLLTYYDGHRDEAARLVAIGESKPDPAIDVPTLAAWTMLANELMNLDEYLTK